MIRTTIWSALMLSKHWRINWTNYSTTRRHPKSSGMMTNSRTGKSRKRLSKRQLKSLLCPWVGDNLFRCQRCHNRRLRQPLWWPVKRNPRLSKCSKPRASQWMKTHPLSSNKSKTATLSSKRLHWLLVKPTLWEKLPSSLAISQTKSVWRITTWLTKTWAISSHL